MRGLLEDGMLKLFLIDKSLRARNENPKLFIRGSYEPFKAEGPKSENIVAFARWHNDLWSITIAPGLIASLVGDGAYLLGSKVGGDNRIPLFNRSSHLLRNSITSQILETKDSLYAGDVLQHFPVAILSGKEGV